MKSATGNVKEEGAPRPAAVVTGGSSGIGLELARLAAAEMPVVLVARSATALHELGQDIAAKGGEAHVLALDLAQAGSGATVEAFLAERGLCCDILVNNAGYGLIGGAAELDRADQLGIIDLNIRALGDLALRFLPGMRARGRGGILNVGSVAGFLPGPNMAVYYASKAFVRSFSDALWEESRRAGVTVTSLNPGPVDTGFFARASGEGAKPKLMKAMRGVSAHDVARAGWRGFKAGKRSVVPGLTNQIATQLVRLVPTRLILTLVRRFQKARVLPAPHPGSGR